MGSDFEFIAAAANGIDDAEREQLHSVLGVGLHSINFSCPLGNGIPDGASTAGK